MQNELPCLFRPVEFRIKHATLDWERRQAHSLRRAVFCEEQGIFQGDDRDSIDDEAHLLVALACVAGMPDTVAGTVRIHRDEHGRWWGSRLAVDLAFRRSGSLGAALIRLAVSSANAIGCDTFLAHVQSQNVPLFRKLRWESLAEETLRDRPHHLMRADLAAYPPFHRMADGFVAHARRS
ncbi:MSMEG_0567/Sll0786 family nitrogen starvation N-acetyltransferase [Bordetella sp. N]|uniref:MSMEG_0567/Sll0786 family nitrogen starvation N-acetyltransferase n=1 Tax=Bordetella sp. N TaxID=1746199 RepID=UPI0007104F74|nr:MSMEG_0567/Sll0786 family nitrogen starvation N-acetyltransferase [Bordetella sp. N]ALM86885.1 histone acetyltransferase [Bordetella sp. N]